MNNLPELPTREEVVVVVMKIYDWTFHMVFLLAIVTIAYCIWHLIPKKEY
jgi:hypothetical protein